MNISDPTNKPPGTWAPARRAAAAIAAPIQRMLAVEATSGVVLLVAAVVALVWANASPDSYVRLWHADVGIRLGPWHVEHPLVFWVNDGLMTVFFFVVGLEIRREIHEGELASVRKASLPVIAAIGGMLIPAAIFLAFNAGRAGSAGWAIPMATDIAFAVGVLTLLGKRVPASLRVLLLALAVIDDLGAIVVIALFYSGGIAVSGLVIIGVGLALVLALRGAGVRAPIAYLPPALVMWAGFLAAGVHPTIAGVVLGLLTPVRPWFGRSGFASTTQEHLDKLHDQDREALLHSLDRIGQAGREAVSPSERLVHVLHPWVAFVVMPLFALANAGVLIGGASFDGDSLWLFIGVVAGLALGKPLGIAAFALAARRIPGSAGHDESSPRGVVLVGLVGGIGFTMSLFIAQLAFPAGPLLDTAKLAILVGSAAAIVAGLVFGLVSYRNARRNNQQSATSSAA